MQTFSSVKGDQYTLLVNTEIWDPSARIAFTCLNCKAAASVRVGLMGIKAPPAWIRDNLLSAFLRLKVPCLCHRCEKNLDPRLVYRAGDEKRLDKALLQHRLSFDSTLELNPKMFRRKLAENVLPSLSSISSSIKDGSIASRRELHTFLGLDKAPPKLVRRANQFWDTLCRLHKAEREDSGDALVEELGQDAEKQLHQLMVRFVDRFVEDTGAVPLWNDSLQQEYDSYLAKWNVWQGMLRPALRLLVVPKIQVVGPITRVKQIDHRILSMTDILSLLIPLHETPIHGLAKVSVVKVDVPPETSWTIDANEATAMYPWLGKLTSSD